MRTIYLFAMIASFALSSCNEAKPTKTIDNLKAGIKGETTASARYAAFSVKAKEEGHEAIATLFAAASKAEAIHAGNHRKVLEGLGVKMDDFKPEFEVKTTAENLQASIDGEGYEVSTMYPQFIADAKTEKVGKAEKSYNWAIDTEKKHHDFYMKALDALKASAENALPTQYAVCPVCGNTYDNAKLDEKCAFCQTGKEKFLLI